MRYATEDVTIGGTVNPKGQANLASYVTAGRCPVPVGDLTPIPSIVNN